MAGPQEPEAPPAAVEPDPASSELPEVQVELLDGTRVRGLLVEETPERVVIRSARITTPFDRARVYRIHRLAPVEDRYRDLRALLRPDDAEGRLYIARWLEESERLRWALDMATEATAIDPENADASELRRRLELRVQLAEAPRGVPRIGSTPRDLETERESRDSRFPLLNEADIRLMRVYEFDFNRPVRIRPINRSTIDKLIADYAHTPAIPDLPEQQRELYRMRPQDVLERMFGALAKDLYGEVEVMDHPYAIERFRTDVHRGWLLNGCATTVCHGGEAAGRFRLATRSARGDLTVYTNLYILDRFVLSDGTPLIDYERPVMSPLLQFGLPVEQSVRPHPEVPSIRSSHRWRPVFRSTEDRAFEEAVEWIGAMYTPRPDYGIVYAPVAPLLPPPPGEPGGEPPVRMPR